MGIIILLKINKWNFYFKSQNNVIIIKKFATNIFRMLGSGPDTTLSISYDAY